MLNSALVILNKPTQNCCFGACNKEGTNTLSSTTKDYWNVYEILIKYFTLVTLLIKGKTTSLSTQILRLVQYLILFLYFVYYEYVRLNSVFSLFSSGTLSNVYMYKTILYAYAYTPTATHKRKLTKCESEFECNFPYFDKTCPNIVTQKKMVLLMVSNYISHLCKSKSNPLTVVMFLPPHKVISVFV